jgi:mannose-6-phosphate isomerase
MSSPNLKGADQFAFEPERVEKPWGHELIWALSQDYAGKFLSVNAGHELSLQFHREKDESWYVLKGRLELHFAGPGEKTMSSEVVTPGAAFRIRPGTVHRVRALVDSVIVEVSTPQLDDVVRLEDSYGRADAEER